MNKGKKCQHKSEDVIPQAYFSWSMEGFPYTPYLVLMCVACDEYFIEKGEAMQKEDE